MLHDLVMLKLFFQVLCILVKHNRICVEGVTSLLNGVQERGSHHVESVLSNDTRLSLISVGGGRESGLRR